MFFWVRTLTMKSLEGMRIICSKQLRNSGFNFKTWLKKLRAVERVCSFLWGMRNERFDLADSRLQFPPEIQRGTGMNSLNLLGAKSEKVIIFQIFLRAWIDLRENGGPERARLPFVAQSCAPHCRPGKI